MSTTPAEQLRQCELNLGTIHQLADVFATNPLIMDALAVLDRHHTDVRDLTDQLAENRTIGCAIGLIMGTHNVDDAAAEDILANLAADFGGDRLAAATDVVARISTQHTVGPGAAEHPA